MMTDKVKFSVLVTVLDQGKLQSCVFDMDPGLIHLPLEDSLIECLLCPAVPPLDAGYEVVGYRAIRTDSLDKQYLVQVEVDVLQPTLLRHAALACHAKCWNDTEWQPGSLGEALYEVLVGSNDGPCADDAGLELKDASFDPDIPFQDQPTPGR